MRQAPGTRRDLQAGTVASPVGAAQQPLVARNAVSGVMTAGPVQRTRQFAVIPPAQNIAQPNQFSNQAPLFNIGVSSPVVRSAPAVSGAPGAPAATQTTRPTATQTTRPTGTVQSTVTTGGRTY